MSQPTTQTTSDPWIFKRIVESNAFSSFIIGVIVFAGILVGVETFPSMYERHGDLLYLLDDVVLGIFTVEVILKMAAEKTRPWRYFKDGWNNFDLIIVGAAWLGMIVNQIEGISIGSSTTVIRSFRIIWIVKIIKNYKNLKILFQTFIGAIP